VPRGVREGLTLTENRRRVHARKAEYVRRHKAGRGCADCPERDPIVLDFDHLDADNKLPCLKSSNRNGGYKRNFTNLSWDAMLDEIAKCEVVCANCHRRRTAARAGWAA
jgi:hypothetical protein